MGLTDKILKTQNGGKRVPPMPENGGVEVVPVRPAAEGQMGLEVPDRPVHSKNAKRRKAAWRLR